MALTVQWANGFEDTENLVIPDDMNKERFINLSLGWEGEYTNNAKYLTEPSWGYGNADGHLRGRSNSNTLTVNYGQDQNQFPRLFRAAADHTKMTLGFAMKMTSTSILNEDRLMIGFRGIGGERIHVAPLLVSGTWRIALYINNILIQSGTAIDILTGKPWVYVELHVNKTAGTVLVRVSGVPECSGTMPVGFIGNHAEFTVRTLDTQFSHNIIFDDIVYYTDSDPIGIVKVDGFFKDGDVMAGFNDSTDNGATDTTGLSETSSQNYRASSTAGQEDRFSYAKILPTGVQATSIVAVIPSILASSGSYSNGNLEMRFTSGSNVTTTDVTSKVKPFTPQLIQGPVFHTDPNTSAAWTRENVQAIQTGYRVKA